MSKKETRCQYKRPRNYFMLDHQVLDHPNFIKLSHLAIHLLLDMCRLYNGFNNGDLSIAHSQMKDRGWARSSLDKAKFELIDSGWITVTRKGGKYYSCALYALSWIPLDDCQDKLDIKAPRGTIFMDIKKR